MPITNDVSLSLGWGNLVQDYGPAVNGFWDQPLQNALADAQNGTGNAIPGGTVYIPPGTYAFQNPLSPMTAPCAIIALEDQETTLAFQVPDYSRSLVIVSGINVLLSGLTISYSGNPTILPSGNTPAIQLNASDGTVLRNVTIRNAFSGIQCTDTTRAFCKRVSVDKTRNPSGTSQVPFGFSATTAGTPPPGASMNCFKCRVGYVAKYLTGTAGFSLSAPYPELSIDSSAAHDAQYGFYLTGAGGSTPSRLRLRNVNAESCQNGIYVDRGSLLQASATVADACGPNALVASSNFSGVVALRGNIGVAFGTSGLIVGDPSGTPTRAIVSSVGDCLASSGGANLGDGVHVSLAAAGSMVIDGSAIYNISPAGAALASAIGIDASSGAGHISIKGVAQGNPDTGARRGLDVRGPASVLNEGSAFASDAFSIAPASLSRVSLHNTAYINPPASITQPPFPSTGDPTSNDSGYDVWVYIVDTSGTSISEIKVNGQLTGLKDTAGTPGVTVVFRVLVPAMGRIAVVSSNRLNWYWIGS